jgi:hypothetical protein
MRTPEFWRRITQVLPELLLDSSALGTKKLNLFLFLKRFLYHLGLCEDSVLFCQNYNVKRLTEIVQANPLLFKVVAQVQKEWTSTSNATTTNDVQLSPGKIFLSQINMI